MDEVVVEAAVAEVTAVVVEEVTIKIAVSTSYNCPVQLLGCV
uniref:Uncharacterized protein n=1 Tax=Ciona savignyi TaxID=51511 RepID=H2YSH9_CIOSA